MRGRVGCALHDYEWCLLELCSAAVLSGGHGFQPLLLLKHGGA